MDALKQLIKEYALVDGFFIPFVGQPIDEARFEAYERSTRTPDDMKYILFYEHYIVQCIHDKFATFSTLSADAIKREVVNVFQEPATDSEFTKIAYKIMMENLPACTITAQDCINVIDILDALMYLPGNILHATYVALNAYFAKSKRLSSTMFAISDGKEKKQEKQEKKQEKEKEKEVKIKHEAPTFKITPPKSNTSVELTKIAFKKKPLYESTYVNGKMHFDGDNLPL